MLHVPRRGDLTEDGAAEKGGELLIAFGFLVHFVPRAGEVVETENPDEQVAVRRQPALFLGHSHICLDSG